jgi:hypothetical protein
VLVGGGVGGGGVLLDGELLTGEAVAGELDVLDGELAGPAEERDLLLEELRKGVVTVCECINRRLA